MPGVRVVLALTAFAIFAGGAAPANSAAPVSPDVARRIAAVWGGTLTFLPRWAPSGVTAAHWWSESCACAMDDNRLRVWFARGGSRLEWVVSDPQEVDRIRAHLGCEGRAIQHRVEGKFETVWGCVRSSGRWGPGFDLIRRLLISVRQRVDRPGRFSVRQLERMVASAGPVAPGRAPGSRYELPSPGEVARISRAFRSPAPLPAVLPPGFLYSDWSLAPRGNIGDHRRDLTVGFGRDSLFAQLVWDVQSGVDSQGLDCPRKASERWPRRVIVHGRPIYVNVGIHGAQVWTCLPPHAAGNARPLELSLWYDIRLNTPAMRRLAIRMVATARV